MNLPRRLTRSGRAAARVLLAGALAVAACGSGESAGDTTGVDAASDATTVQAVDAGSDDVVVPQLDFLGDLVGVVSDPITIPVDGNAIDVPLGDGTTLRVPDGAFAAATELTARVVELDFAQYAVNGPTGVAYVVSTVEDVALATPVLLDVPRAPDRLRVTQLVDGTWREVAVAVAVEDGTSARIPIAHFSTVPTVVVEDGPGDPRPVGDDPEGETAGAFLTACLFAIAGPTLDHAEYGTAIAFSICTRALIDRFTPSGEHVSVECVGDKIGGEVDLRAAIDACVADEQRPDSTDDVASADDRTQPSTETSTEASRAPSADEPPAPTDIGPLGWSGDMTLTAGSSLQQLGPATVDITRTAGTNTFEIVFDATSTSVTDFFEIGECTTNLNKRYVGTGTFDPDVPDRIVFTGDQVVDWQYPDCSGIAENDNVRVGDQFFVQITATGLEGGFEGWTFSLSGVPVPLPA